MRIGDVYVGVDLGGTNIKSGLLTDAGEVIAEKATDTEAEGGVTHVLDRMADLVSELMESAGSQFRVVGVGVGVPGQVDVRVGAVREPPNLPGWIEVKVESEMKKRLGLPVSMDNDANAAALGEFAYGAGRGVTEMLMVTLGTGVGGGLILRGEVYRGAVGAAAEFGHVIVQRYGWVCGCGRKGCVEAYVGTRGILRFVEEKLRSGRESLLRNIEPGRMTPKAIFESASRGDEVAVEVFRDVGEYLGVGLGSVANLLNIERVVIGGGVAKAGEFIFGPTRRSLAETALAASRDVIDVVPAALGERAGFIGAARLAILKSKE